MELEDQFIGFTPEMNRRVRIPEPPPVRLVTIDDARLEAASGLERELDEFYGGLLQMEREPDSEFPVYRAANFRIHFDILEPPLRRDDLRALGLEVPSLAEAEQKLIDAGCRYERQRGLTAAADKLVLLDPAGNWIEITEMRSI